MPQLLVLGLYAGFAPVAAAALILLLRSTAPLRRAGAYVLGYVAALVGVTILAALLLDWTSGAVLAALASWLRRPRPEPRTVRYVVDVTIGLALLALAVWRWLRWWHEPARPYTPPKQLGVVDRIGPGGAFGLGAALCAGNVDNVLVFLVGVNRIGDAALGLVRGLVTYTLFLLLSAASVLAPLAVYLWRPDRAAARLDALAGWLGRASGALIVAVLAAVGLWLTAIGLRGLLA